MRLNCVQENKVVGYAGICKVIILLLLAKTSWRGEQMKYLGA
jgi:DMSO/TMAO reductase YedYZ heme-binding membrane subunit